MEALKFIKNQASLPTRYGDFTILTYDFADIPFTQVALLKGDIPKLTRQKKVLARIHSECFTGDVLASLRCDCGDQLAFSLNLIAEKGTGLVIYLRGQEGRGIGLANKIKAYALQEQGYDTYEANQQLGFQPDERDYVAAVRILQDLHIGAVALITNNPEKIAYLEKNDISIKEIIPTQVEKNSYNKSYIETKINKMGHLFPLE